MTINLRDKTTARLLGSTFALALAASPLSLAFDHHGLHIGANAAFAKDGSSGSGSGGSGGGSGSGGSSSGSGSSGSDHDSDGGDHSGPGRGGDGGGDDGGRGAAVTMMGPTTMPVTTTAATAPSITDAMAPRSKSAETMSKWSTPAASRKRSRTAATS